MGNVFDEFEGEVDEKNKIYTLRKLYEHLRPRLPDSWLVLLLIA